MFCKNEKISPARMPSMQYVDNSHRPSIFLGINLLLATYFLTGFPPDFIFLDSLTANETICGGL